MRRSDSLQFMHRVLLAACAVTIAPGVVAPQSADADDELIGKQTAAAPPADVVKEVERIRRELGGTAVDGFETLRLKTETSEARRREGRAMSARRQEPVGLDLARRITVLRRAAQELDLAANRVEELDLYEEADAVRGTARRLRNVARELAGKKREAQLPAPPAQTGPDPSQ